METVARPRPRPASRRCAERLETYVAALVDAAPPLTAEQAGRLRLLLVQADPDRHLWWVPATDVERR